MTVLHRHGRLMGSALRDRVAQIVSEAAPAVVSTGEVRHALGTYRLKTCGCSFYMRACEDPTHQEDVGDRLYDHSAVLGPLKALERLGMVEHVDRGMWLWRR